MTAGVPLVTIVMYHRVLPPRTGPLGRLNALDLTAFREQLTYIRHHYTPVSAADLVGAAAGSPLPPRPIVLTFDDGYRDHHRYVLPLLESFSMPAVFFPVSSSMLDRHVLDVNKIQYILATSDATRVVETIEAAIAHQSRHGDAPSPAEYRATWWKPSRFDPAPVVYVKRLLQHALPEPIRRSLVDRLFAELVSGDERAFADELYMSVVEARQLQEAGMTIGAHGDRHVRLPTMSREDQAREIDGALRVLDALGIARREFVYSYANGDHDADSVDLLRARGCAVAVTTRPDLARISADAMLTLARLATNDLPVHADAEPNEWTQRAAGSREDLGREH